MNGILRLPWDLPQLFYINSFINLLVSKAIWNHFLFLTNCFSLLFENSLTPNIFVWLVYPPNSTLIDPIIRRFIVYVNCRWRIRMQPSESLAEHKMVIGRRVYLVLERVSDILHTSNILYARKQK